MRWQTLGMMMLGPLALAGLGGLGAGVLAACSSSNPETADGGLDSGPVCPTSVVDQNGTHCDAPEGYLCPVGFPCTDPPIAQQANCVCTGSKWQCSYSASDAGAITPGTTPVCRSYGHGMQSSCPDKESPNSTCSVAGLICTYPGLVCPGTSFATTDTCQCVSGPDAGLVYDCERELCNPTSDAMVPPLPDTGTPDMGVPDAGGDAPASG